MNNFLKISFLCILSAQQLSAGNIDNKIINRLKKQIKQTLNIFKEKTKKAFEATKRQSKKVLKFSKEHKKAIGLTVGTLSTCVAIFGIGYIEARAKGADDHYAKKYGLIFGIRKVFLAPPIHLLNKTVIFLENSEAMHNSKLTKKLDDFLKYAGKFSDEDIFKYVPTGKGLPKLDGSQRYHLTLGEITPPDFVNWQYYAEIRDKYFWW